MKKNIIAFIIIIIILGLIFIPKYFRVGDKEVRFKTLEKEEIPQKIVDVLPNYLADERALGCKVDEEINRKDKNRRGLSISYICCF